MNDSGFASLPSRVSDAEKGSKAVMGLRQQDKLGRRAKSQRQARKAESGGKVNWRVFEPPAGRDEISVDRLGVVPDDKVAKVALREFDDKFYGWYVLTVWDVIGAGCTARCSNTDSNPRQSHSGVHARQVPCREIGIVRDGSLPKPWGVLARGGRRWRGATGR